MNRMFQFLLRKAMFSKLSSQHRNDAKIWMAFSQWVTDKRYMAAENEEEAALEMGVSREQLAYFCSDRLGRSFRKIRKEFRIEEACRILRRNPGISLEILAETVGIPDKSNFRKQFIEVTGVSPKVWTEKSRQ